MSFFWILDLAPEDFGLEDSSFLLYRLGNLFLSAMLVSLFDRYLYTNLYDCTYYTCMYTFFTYTGLYTCCGRTCRDLGYDLD